MTKGTDPTELTWQDRVFARYVDRIDRRFQASRSMGSTFLMVCVAAAVVFGGGLISTVMINSMGGGSDPATQDRLLRLSAMGAAGIIVLGAIWVALEPLWLSASAYRAISRLSDEEAREAKERYLARHSQGHDEVDR